MNNYELPDGFLPMSELPTDKRELQGRRFNVVFSNGEMGCMDLYDTIYTSMHPVGFQIVEPLKKKRWKPGMRQTYYFAVSTGKWFAVCDATWIGSTSDNERYEYGNCFPTGEITQKVIDAMETIAQVRERVGV